MGQDFVLNDRGVILNVDIFDGHCWNLDGILGHAEGECARVELTSEIITRRNAFAIDASTPTMSNSMERCDSLLTDTLMVCSKCIHECIS